MLIAGLRTICRQRFHNIIWNIKTSRHMRGFSMRVPYMKALCWPRNAVRQNHRHWFQDPIPSWEKPSFLSFFFRLLMCTNFGFFPSIFPIDNHPDFIKFSTRLINSSRCTIFVVPSFNCRSFYIMSPNTDFNLAKFSICSRIILPNTDFSRSP